MMKTYLYPKPFRCGQPTLVYVVHDTQGYWLGIAHEPVRGFVKRDRGSTRAYNAVARLRITVQFYLSFTREAALNRKRRFPLEVLTQHGVHNG